MTTQRPVMTNLFKKLTENGMISTEIISGEGL